MIIGIDHGYYAIKTKQVCFPTGLMRYTYEPYTMQNVLQYGGAYYVCGTGRQTLVKDKTANDNYYLLTMAAIAQEIRWHRRFGSGKGRNLPRLFLQPDFPLPDLEGKNRNLRNICFGRNSLSAFSTKGSAMKSRLKM